MAETSSCEFVEWMVYLQELDNRKEPIHYYLAQIALEVRRTLTPKKRWKIQDFLLSFKKPTRKKEPVTAAEKELYLQRSKMFWKALVQNPKTPPKKK